MIDKLSAFYFQKTEPAKSCLLALRDIILAYDTSMEETISYGMPLFTYMGKRFCYLWTDKKTQQPYILIVDGNKINHPDLIKGNRARMKVLPIDATKDIEIHTIYEVFNLLILSHRRTK